jgi:hypothetical protein
VDASTLSISFRLNGSAAPISSGSSSAEYVVPDAASVSPILLAAKRCTEQPDARMAIANMARPAHFLDSKCMVIGTPAMMAWQAPAHIFDTIGGRKVLNNTRMERIG